MKTFVKSYSLKFTYSHGMLGNGKPADVICKETENYVLKWLLQVFHPIQKKTQPYKKENRVVSIQNLFVDYSQPSIFMSLDYTKELNSPIVLQKIESWKEWLLEEDEIEESIYDNQSMTSHSFFSWEKDYCAAFLIKSSTLWVEWDIDITVECYVTVKGNNNPLLILLKIIEDHLSNFGNIKDISIEQRTKDIQQINNEISQVKLKTKIGFTDEKRKDEEYEIIVTFKPSTGEKLWLWWIKEKIYWQYIKQIGVEDKDIIYIKATDKNRQSLDIIEWDDWNLNAAVLYKKPLPENEWKEFDKFMLWLTEEKNTKFQFSIIENIDD
jgi:hypothetical protein